MKIVKLRILQLIVVASLAAIMIVSALDSTFAQTSQERLGAVYIAEVEGVISPPVANYLLRVLDEAENQNASLVVIKMDTPGGLDTSMREIIRAILESPVPVAVYVSPDGARAASAGLFILVSSHIAVMAPGTNTGAAHPVGLGGGAEAEVLTSKVVNDAAAYIRSLAVRHGRNAEWAEQAVRESVSITEYEAIELNLIDFIATSLDDLLEQAEGRTVRTSAGEVTLQVVNAPRHEAPMTFSERFLHVLLDPNIAFILLTIGSIGIIAELYNPGALIPGMTGIIALILAFFALGNLPTNWAGVALVVVALILFVAELNTESSGVLTTGGLVAFVLGGLILFRPFQPSSPVLPDLRVSPLLLAVTSVSMMGFIFFVIGQALRARKLPILTGYEEFIGHSAEVRYALNPQGRVWFQGQLWFAKTPTEQHVEVGQQVEIVAIEDLTLIVKPENLDLSN